MWSTWLVKSRADLKRRWLQVAILAIMLVAGSAAITLALTVDRSTNRVIEIVQEDANSAHVWLYGEPETLTQAAERTGVEESSEVFVTINGELVHQGEAHEASIWGMSTAPAVAPGLLTEGRWPSAGTDDEVVIGSGLARTAEIRIGDGVLLLAPNTRAASYEVVGITTPTYKVPYPQQTPASVFASEATIESLAGGEPAALGDSERADLGLDFALGVRLAAGTSPEGFVSGLTGMTAVTWKEVRDAVAEESTGPPTMLRVFAIFAVMASGFVTAATIANHAFAQQREIGLLKAVGFTPRQTTALLLVQMLAIAVPAAIVGIAIGVIATPFFQWSVTDILDTEAVRSVHVPTLIGVFVAVQVLVVASALLPARRAGRTRIIDAVAMARRQVGAGASLIARGADSLGMPQVLVVGLKDTFTRPLRSWMILAAIAVAVATLMMAFTFRHSIQRITSDPALIGAKPYELQAALLSDLTPARSSETELPRAGITHEEAEQLVAAHPDVAAFVTDRAEVVTIQDLDVITRAIGGDIQTMGFELAEGRLPSSSNEATIGLGLANELSLTTGEQLVVDIVPGQSATLEVVGTYYADENDGLVLMYWLETLQALAPGVAPGVFDIKLVDGADLDDVVADLAAASEARLALTNLTREADADISEGRRLITPMTLLGAGLALIAIGNLLSSLVFSIRERTAEFGILKAIGFTPAQIVTVVMAGIAPLALLGTLIGAPVGYWLIDALMRSQAESHQPSDIIELPGLPWLAALVAIALAISFIGAYLPAVRAGRLGVAEALRSE